VIFNDILTYVRAQAALHALEELAANDDDPDVDVYDDDDVRSVPVYSLIGGWDV
jgi:hypothetical protein